MKALFELFRRFDARRIFGFIRRLGACHVQKSSVTICVLPAPSGWRATRFKMLGDHAPIIISIHTLRVEGDEEKPSKETTVYDFYPHPPGGGRLILDRCRLFCYLISIHTLRVEGDSAATHARCAIIISIHTLRVEGDFWERRLDAKICISIHTLRVEGDSKNGQSFRLFLRKREKNLPL